ncbi:MAG: hypothetical protein BroJett011_53270 [Chloroflexota bacterium]|nr:MAG: hypothetical protein BroJett011_53270 [Chloroflexota bacterium]
MVSGRIQPNRGLILAASLTLTFILLNIIAYRQAQAMLTFTQIGSRTAAPESLSIWQKVKMLFTGVNIPKPLNNSKPDSWALTFTVHRFKVTEIVELEAWHIPHPQAKGLILLFHGYASSKSSLLPEAKALHELGYATFLVDFRGSGGSNGSKTSIGFYEADDVAKAFAYAGLLAVDQPLILYGRSMGGAAVLRAISVHHLRPAGVILEAVFDKMLSTVQNRFRAVGLPSFPATQLLVFWGSIQNGSSGFRHNPVEYAAGVQCPALILHGTDDPRATLAEGRAVFSQLGGKKWFEVFTGVGHEAYLAAEPEQWKQSVTLFLARLHDDIT